MKDFKTYEEQISILKLRGIVIDDEEKTIEILSECNYYNLINGYKELFIKRTHNIEDENENINIEEYKKNVNFIEIYSLYKFDSEIKRIFLNKILKVENILRSLIAYHFSKIHGNDNYLKFDSFDNLRNVNAPEKTVKDRAIYIHALISSINQTLAKSILKKDYISHYITKYGFVPLWVLVNILTFGTLSKFYDLMYQPERVEISKYFNVKENELSQYIKLMASYRNLCAHDERLYNTKLGTTYSISDTIYHEQLHIPKKNGRYAYGKNDLFALMITLKTLLSREEFLNLYNVVNHQVYRLEANLKSININDVYEMMGFPTTWRSIRKS